jgi:hypothetical protein
MPEANPFRSIIAVLGGIGLASLISEALEFTLVSAAAGGPIPDLGAYFEVRNRPTILAAKLVCNSLAAILGGYITAKVAGAHEMLHAGAAAAIQTIALIWGFTVGEYASFTPVWMRVALVLLTGPAMLVGASVRAKATGHW